MSQTNFKFEINFGANELCQTIHDAVILEAQDKELRRGNINLSVEDSILVISIEAIDIVAARSLFNSLMRVVKTSFDIVRIIDFKE